MELDLPVCAALDDDHVVELDQMGLLRLTHVRRDLARRCQVGIGDCNEIAHERLLVG